jgi:hypothetical protein
MITDRKGVGYMSERISLLATQGISTSNFEIQLVPLEPFDSKIPKRNSVNFERVSETATLTEMQAVEKEAARAAVRFQADAFKGENPEAPAKGPGEKKLAAQAEKVQALNLALAELDRELCKLGKAHGPELLAYATDYVSDYADAVQDAEAELRRAQAELELARAHSAVVIALASGQLRKPSRVKTHEQREQERAAKAAAAAEFEQRKREAAEKNRGIGIR